MVTKNDEYEAVPRNQAQQDAWDSHAAIKGPRVARTGGYTPPAPYDNTNAVTIAGSNQDSKEFIAQKNDRIRNQRSGRMFADSIKGKTAPEIQALTSAFGQSAQNARQGTTERGLAERAAPVNALARDKFKNDRSVALDTFKRSGEVSDRKFGLEQGKFDFESGMKKRAYNQALERSTDYMDDKGITQSHPGKTLAAQYSSIGNAKAKAAFLKKLSPEQKAQMTEFGNVMKGAYDLGGAQQEEAPQTEIVQIDGVWQERPVVGSPAPVAAPVPTTGQGTPAQAGVIPNAIPQGAYGSTGTESFATGLRKKTGAKDLPPVWGSGLGGM